MKSSKEIHFATAEEKAFWIESIQSDFREGIADPMEVEKLRALLLDDSEAREIYLHSNTLTNLLESSSTITAQATPRRSFSIVRWTTGLGIAAAVAFGIWFSFQSPADPPSTPEPVPAWLATLSSSNEPVWDGPGIVSGKFYTGRFKLKSGIAELEFRNGAQFILEGPVAFEIIDGAKIELEYGKLWGHCPPTAHGFEVLAPGGNRIVDLGTEFGIGVAPSGDVEVHVFDGEVEVFSDERQKQALDAGSALKLSPGQKPFALTANFETFTDTDKLHSALFQMHRTAVLEREDFLFYSDFSVVPGKQPILKAISSLPIKGKVQGALPVKGRIADKSALLFENEKDAVALDLRTLPLGEEFTLAMWIKPTNFAKSHMALLNSNGFGDGKIHFQVHDDGRLVTAIGGMSRFGSARDTIKTNEWQMVSVSWNLKTRRAKLFLNGELLKTRRNQFKTKTPPSTANFGRCQIGSWAKPTYGHNRSFEGRIDEVMIFSSQLSDDEMAKLFEQSRP